MAEELKQLFSNDKADEIISAIAQGDKVSRQQGAGNVGKALVVGEDGYVTTANTTLSDTAIAALLNCFAHVTWVDAYGQNYYDILEAALKENSYSNKKSYTIHDLVLTNGRATTLDNGKLGIWYRNEQERMVCGVSYGDEPYYDRETEEPLDIYPIPVPKNAKAVIVSATPSNISVDISTRRFNKDISYGVFRYSTGTSGLPGIVNLHGEEYITLNIMCPAGISVQDLVTDISITFLTTEIYKENEWTYHLGNEKYDLYLSRGTLHSVDDHPRVMTSQQYGGVVGVRNGIQEYITDDGETIDRHMPIPIPEGAKAVRMSITPNNLDVNMHTRAYNANIRDYDAYIQTTGRIKGSAYLNIGENEKYLLSFVRTDSGTLDFDAIEDISITFLNQPISEGGE